MEYTINYHTGAGNQTIKTDDIKAVLLAADTGAAYTQQPITINDADGAEIARREWCGTSDGEEETNDPIRFGSFGYYADWQFAQDK